MCIYGNPREWMATTEIPIGCPEGAVTFSVSYSSARKGIMGDSVTRSTDGTSVSVGKPFSSFFGGVSKKRDACFFVGSYAEERWCILEN